MRVRYKKPTGKCCPIPPWKRASDWKKGDGNDWKEGERALIGGS
jgi:hypothetical protein